MQTANSRGLTTTTPREPASLGPHDRPGRAGLVGEIALVGAMLVAYLALRVVVEGSADDAIANAEDLLTFERSLGLDIERGAQAAVPVDSWGMDVFNVIYVWLYWPLLLAALAFLWFRDATAYTVFRNSLVVAAGIGLVVFALYPVAPPRFLSGFTDTVGTSRDTSLTNKFAAMPSFHVGWLAIAALMAIQVTKSRVGRWVLVVPPVVMAAAVVFTANHYLLDGVAGVAISAAALYAAHRWQRRGADPAPAPR